ncbi:Nuclear aminoacylation-dependent tRNA export pathway component [Mucor circinelloides]
MRHPDVLRYLDGVETEQSIMFVTDPVEPLSNQLNQDPDKNLVLWGLYKVANAIKFLNNDCDLVHGNVRIASIFTNKAGEWKLGGFELLCSMKEESPIILTFGGIVPDAQRYATPEVKKSGWTAIKDLPSSAVDSYHLGCLIYEAYNHRFETSDSLLTQKGSIPGNMQRIYTMLLSPSFRKRASADMFLDEGLKPRGFFSTDFVKVNLFLENISIKEQGEKEGFFRQLDSTIDTFPSEFSKHKILPELIKAFEFGSGGAKALSAIVKVGEHLSDEEYESVVIQPIIRMFASPDRAIRVSLLENMPKFIDHMTNKMITNQVFPHIATGFTDTIPIIREQTIKSTLLIVPKLSERIINYELLKYLAKLQMDPEPGIRTNTVICLGKIAKHLSDSTRKKVLVSGFTRSLRDGFHHARIAALMALNATIEYYDAQECATKILPAVSVMLIDKEKPVRDQAFKVMNSFVVKVQEFAERMPDTAIVERANTPTSEENAIAAANQGAGMAGVLGGATKGLAGWAVSSLQSRFSSPSGEIGNPMSSQGSTPVIENDANSTAKKTSGMQLGVNSNHHHTLIEADDTEDTNGWDEEESDPFDFNQPVDNDDGDNEEDSAWDSFDQPSSVAFSPPPTQKSAASPISSFGSYPSSFAGNTQKPKAQGSMKLGHKSKTLDLDLDDNNSSVDSFVTQIASETKQSSSIPSSQGVNKDERKAELERRREERRQRMAELREKKKGGGLGAKKVENIGL